MKIIKNFFYKNEKWLTPTALFGGFILDNFTLRQSDLIVENILIALYFVIVFVGVFFWHKIEIKKNKTVALLDTQSLIFIVSQFAFGGLFSSLTVFYIKSASIFASWPFLLILFGGMIATEYLKKHFSHFVVQIATLYILMFTYLILLVPLVIRSINAWVFILSGILSLIGIFLYLFIFNIFVPIFTKNKEKYFLIVVGAIYLCINIFYFTNTIPPIPLALRDSGVYKSVVKQGSTYLFSNFEHSFSFRKIKREYVVEKGAPVYFYSSIYAPVKFKQKIVHQWQKKNTKGEWSTVSNITFPIYGGNSSGYRGYSISNNVSSGEWRIFVKTDKGQVLGSESFVVR